MGRRGKSIPYQFAAMMGLPSGLTRFDFGFIRTLGIEDLFFFFWSSRPIFAELWRVGVTWRMRWAKVFRTSSFEEDFRAEKFCGR